jgi:sensor histidine kinase YesM
MRASPGTAQLNDWVEVRPSRLRNLAGALGVLRIPISRWAFLVWCIFSFMSWNWAFYQLAAHGLIERGLAAVSMLLWPVVAAACSLPFAWASDRRKEAHHRRELDELRRYREEANLKLLVLQAQIEPHFLFNTLASLRALLREDVGQAEAMVDALVRHLRAVLPVMREQTADSTLADQLSICSSYLELMQIRLENRLTYRIDVPADLQATSFPPLMLVTLVENAVKHGVEPKIGAARICIEAERVARPSGVTLTVRVTDDGVGLSMGLGNGLGLRNIREQLAVRYGESAMLALSSRPEGGTVASIQIPLSETSVP